MDLITFIPFSIHKNLFDAYEICIKGLNKSDWVIMFDHDVYRVDPGWYKKTMSGIEEYKGNLFTGWTNRIGCYWQVDYRSPESDNIVDHMNYVNTREKQLVYDQTDLQLCGGFYFVFQKKWWEECKGDIGKWHYGGGSLGMDNDFHRSTRERGGKLIQLDIYFYHYYRGGDINKKGHLL